MFDDIPKNSLFYKLATEETMNVERDEKTGAIIIDEDNEITKYGMDYVYGFITGVPITSPVISIYQVELTKAFSYLCVDKPFFRKAFPQTDTVYRLDSFRGRSGEYTLDIRFFGDEKYVCVVSKGINHVFLKATMEENIIILSDEKEKIGVIEVDSYGTAFLNSAFENVKIEILTPFNWKNSVPETLFKPKEEEEVKK